MRIAIVDDITSERNELRSQLSLLLERYSLEAQIYEYDSGEALLSAAEQTPFNLIFLDIYMHGINGIDTARKLRTFDSDCLLVFTTSSADHALDGFRVRALHYLVKPYTFKEVELLFDEIQNRLPAPDKYIEVKTAGHMMRIRTNDIMYAEHFQHLIHIYLPDKSNIITRMTFGNFTDMLSSEKSFFICGRGIIVNLAHVKDFDGTLFYLDNHTTLPVSRNLSQKARTAFGDYLFQRGRVM